MKRRSFKKLKVLKNMKFSSQSINNQQNIEQKTKAINMRPLAANLTSISLIIVACFALGGLQPGCLASTSGAKFRSQFTLDELTNADLSYQPLIFGSGSSYHSPSSAATRSNQVAVTMAPQAAAGDGGPSLAAAAGRQHQLRFIEGALAAAAAIKRKQLKRQLNMKRAGGDQRSCPPTKPFLCPSDDPSGGECIPIQYLCDGSSDCPATSSLAGGYDEDPLLCTAAKRPPVEETANFLRTLLNNHGPQYIEKLFGGKIGQALEPLGGPERVAVALSVSKTIEDFGKALHLMRGDIEYLRSVLVAVQTSDADELKRLGIRNGELADMKFFLEKLFSTGFLD